MSYHFAHSQKAVDDLISGKTPEMPVVVFANRQDAKAYPGLIELHEAKTFGVVQILDNQPFFVVSDPKTLYGDNPKYSERTRPVWIYPELVENSASVAPPSEIESQARFTNETMTRQELVGFYFKLYKQTVLDAMNVDIEHIELWYGESGDGVFNEGILMTWPRIDKREFERLLKPVLIKEGGHHLLMVQPPIAV